MATLVAWQGDTTGLAAYYALMAGLCVIWPLAGFSAYVTLLYSVRPAMEALAWWEGASDARGAPEVSPSSPLGADQVAQVLAGRTDIEAIRARAVWYAWEGRDAEAQVEIDQWNPTNAADRVRRQRVISHLRWLHGTDDSFELPLATAARIADPEARAGAVAGVLVDRAMRKTRLGRDPFPDLVAARRALGPYLAPHEPWFAVPGSPQALQRLLVVSTIPSIVVGSVYGFLALLTTGY